MKSHLILVLKVALVLFFLRGEFCAIGYIRDQMALEKTLHAIGENCCKNQPPTLIYKNRKGELVYIFGECDKKANSPKARKETIKRSHRPAPRKVRATTSQKKMIDYAWRISHGDEQFIAMIEAESRWNPRAIEVLEDGSAGYGLGLCQVDSRHWPKIHNNQLYRSDWAYQVRTCWKLWESGVKFYGHDKNDEMISRFWWPSRDNS